jgi:PAS domain S-box-containing protein
LAGSHDLALVVLSVAIAIFASFVALDVAGRLRASRGRARLWWLALAATVMGGGAWAMHFVAILSFTIGLPVRYDLGLTVASLLVAVLVTGAAFAFVGAGKAARWRLLIGGLLMGFGIAATHYLGMMAVQMDATIHYDPLLFAFSVVIAIVAAAAALWLSCNVGAYWQKLAGAAIMALGVAGMHYVGMAAAEYRLALLTPLFSSSMNISPQILAVGIAGATFSLLLLGLVSAVADRRLSTTHARAARQLEVSARRYRSLIRNSSDVIAIIDARGKFAYCSESAKRILGFAPSWLTGRRMDEFMSPADLGAFYAFIARVQAEHGVNMTAEIQLRHADGEWRVFEIACCNLQDDPGIAGIVANLRDMTERKRIFDELSAAKDLADKANRSKSAFLAAMSHELRTPLNAIIGFSEVIGTGALGADAGPRVLDYSKLIEESGRHLLSLINDILDLSKAESGKMTLLEDYIRPADVAADSLRMVGAYSGKTRAALDVSVPADLPYLYGDKRRVRQILINILANAFKFTEEGGRVSLSAALDRGAADGAGAGDLLFTVADSGIGMTAEEIMKAMEPFRQIDSRLSRKYEGTGLGLPLTKHLVELHGGRLDILSTPDVGTSVTMRFPASRLHSTYAEEDKLSPELVDDGSSTRLRA